MHRIAFTLLVGLPIGLLADVRYTIVNLEAVGSGDTYLSEATAINDLGQVVGSFITPDLAERRAFFYTEGLGMIDLGHNGGGVAYAQGINNAGQIAGYGTLAQAGGFVGWRYTDTTGFLYLGSLGGRETEVSGLNKSGQVTGFSELPGGVGHAFRYTDGIGMEDLGSLYGGGSRGWAINDHGWITGQSDGWNAFLYRDGVGMAYLGPGSGYAINNLGIVAGEYGSGLGAPVIYRDGQPHLLGHLGGGAGAALGINDLNTVVGVGLDSSSVFRAFLWTEYEGLLDLDYLIDPNSGWSLSEATDINESGQIVGNGWFNGKRVAFRLDPIPEPATWALLGCGGLVLLAVHSRRRG